MNLQIACFTFLITVAALAVSPKAEDSMLLTLNIRAQVEEAPGKWKTVEHKRQVTAANTAIVICDMWDKHWCKGATGRCEEISKRMAPVIDSARSKGVLIIHAPSECMKSYVDTPQRKLAESAPKSDPPKPRNIAEPPLPIDDSDGGCDDIPQCKNYQAWTKENSNIPIAEGDAISDNGQEIYNLLKARNIRLLLVMGVHTNMCVLGRSFAIRQMTKWEVPCVLVRDLTDTMYNPRMKPMVPHEEGTKLVVEHIEKYWCPSISSKDLLKK
jgi:nicotinamidase-related amidase